MSQNDHSEPAEILGLFDKRQSVIRPGLDRIRSSLETLGFPGLKTPRVVVAGTNGKGTTSGMIWRLLSAAGLRVGLFTSPHLVEFSERFSVSNLAVTNPLLIELIQGLQKKLPSQLWTDLTFFEINTLLAFLVFDRFNTDINVLEIGLGGRLDCVNVYDADVAVITSIGFDHMEFLGNSLTAIAREKAGIMRPGRPVIWCAKGWQNTEADEAIALHAKQLGATLIRALDTTDETCPHSLKGRPRFLRQNFQLARAAIEELIRRRVIRSDVASEFVDLNQLYDSPKAPWPVTFTGRFDLVCVSRHDEKIEVLLDVCHNSHGAQALSEALMGLPSVSSGGRVYCLFSVLSDKDVTGIWSALRGKIKEVIPFRSKSSRSWDRVPPEMAKDGVGMMAESFDQAWKQALNNPRWRDGTPWLICGSVAAVGEVISYWRTNGWQLERTSSV